MKRMIQEVVDLLINQKSRQRPILSHFKAKFQFMSQLLGFWGKHAAWTINARLAEPDDLPELAEIEQEAISSSLDLQLAVARLETYGHRAGLVNTSSILPSLELGMDAEREGGWEVGPSVGFPLPLFDQGQAQKSIAAAEVRRQQAAYYDKGVEIRSVARVLRQQLITAHETATSYRDAILPMQTQISAETQSLYNAMQIGVFQLLTARQQEVMAGKNYIEALKQYWTIRADYELLMQGKLPGNRSP